MIGDSNEEIELLHFFSGVCGTFSDLIRRSHFIYGTETFCSGDTVHHAVELLITKTVHRSDMRTGTLMDRRNFVISFLLRSPCM